MRRIKTLFGTVLTITASAVFLAGCSNSPKPEESATAFLNAYLSADYATAAAMCTGELSAFLNESVKEFEALPDSVKSIIKRHTSYMTPHVDSIARTGSQDTLVVCYTIVKNDPADTLATGTAEQLINSRLSIVKEGEEWKVAALNEI